MGSQRVGEGGVGSQRVGEGGWVVRGWGRGVGSQRVGEGVG